MVCERPGQQQSSKDRGVKRDSAGKWAADRIGLVEDVNVIGHFATSSAFVTTLMSNFSLPSSDRTFANTSKVSRRSPRTKTELVLNRERISEPRRLMFLTGASFK